MDINTTIKQFVRDVSSKDYASANKHLGNIVNEKLKNRIREIDNQISVRLAKKS